MERATGSLLLVALLAGSLLVALQAPRARVPRTPTAPAGPAAAPQPLAAPVRASVPEPRREAREPARALAQPAESPARPVAARPEAEGRVLAGWVLDPDGRPLSRARVTPWHAAGPARVLDTACAELSDWSGRFEVRGAARGASALRVEHPRFLPWEGVVAGDTPLEIRLEAPYTARLRVLDAHAAPALGSRVRFLGAGPRPAWHERTVDASGRVTLTGLPPGPLSVWVEGPNGTLGPVEVESGSPQEAVLRLAPTRPLHVTVRDAAGAPLANARVVLLPPEERRALQSARTDARGEARFPAAPAAPIRITAEHAQGLFECLPVESATDAIELRSGPCGALRLQATGHPALRIELTPADPAAEGHVLVLREGRDLRVAPLATGTWSVRGAALPATGAELPGMAAVPITAFQTSFVIRAAETTELALQLPRGATLSAALAWPSDAIQAIELLSWPPGGEPTAIAWTALESPFASAAPVRFEGLPEGRYALALCAAGGGRWQDPRVFVLAPGEERQTTLAPGAEACEIVVHDRAGQRLASASARLENQAPRPGGALSDATRVLDTRARPSLAGADALGRIRLELWPGGHQRVVVEAPGFRPHTLELGDAPGRIDLALEGT